MVVEHAIETSMQGVAVTHAMTKGVDLTLVLQSLIAWLDADEAANHGTKLPLIISVEDDLVNAGSMESMQCRTLQR